MIDEEYKIMQKARRYDISVSEYIKSDKDADDLLDKVYEHAQRVKGSTSRASKAKLGEEISKIECLYAYCWKKQDPFFMSKLKEIRKIRDDIKIPKNSWCYMGEW